MCPINIVAWSMVQNYDYEGQVSYTRAYKLYLFFIFSLLCFYYVTDIIKKLEICLLVTLTINKDYIWAHSNWFAQNQYPNVKNSLYQPLRTKYPIQALFQLPT